MKRLKMASLFLVLCFLSFAFTALSLSTQEERQTSIFSDPQKTKRNLHTINYDSSSSYHCTESGYCVVDYHPLVTVVNTDTAVVPHVTTTLYNQYVESTLHNKFTCAGCVSVSNSLTCVFDTSLCNQLCQYQITLLSPQSSYIFQHDPNDSKIEQSSTTTEADYYTNANVNCPVTCTWSYNNTISTYPTNYMPSKYIWVEHGDITLTNPKGGFSFQINQPFYAKISMGCDNKFQQIYYVITVEVHCTTTSAVLNDPTLYLDGSTFDMTQIWIIIPNQDPTFIFPQPLYNADGLGCQMHHVLDNDAGCSVYPNIVSDVPSGSMRCLPTVNSNSQSKYQIQTISRLKYTETVVHLTDYPFKIKSTALGWTTAEAPLISSLYILRVQCGPISVWGTNSGVDTRAVTPVTKNIGGINALLGGASATDMYDQTVINADLTYSKNCRVISETLVASTSYLHTYIAWQTTPPATLRTNFCCWEFDQNELALATTSCSYTGTGPCASASSSALNAGVIHFTDPSKMYIQQTHTVYYRVEFEGGNIRYYQYDFKIICMSSLVLLFNQADTAYLDSGIHYEDLTYSSTSITQFEVTFPASPLAQMTRTSGSYDVVNCGPHYEVYYQGTTSSTELTTLLSGDTGAVRLQSNCGSGLNYGCSKKYADSTPYLGSTNDASTGVTMKKTSGCSDQFDTACRTLVISMTHLRRIEFSVIIRASQNTDPVYDSYQLPFQLTIRCDLGVQSSFLQSLVNTVTNSASQSALIQYKLTSDHPTTYFEDVIYTFKPFTAQPSLCVVDFYEIFGDTACTIAHPDVYYAPNTNTYPLTDTSPSTLATTKTSAFRTFYYNSAGNEGQGDISEIRIYLKKRYCTNCDVAPCRTGTCTCTGSGQSVVCSSTANKDCYEPCTCLAVGCTPSYYTTQAEEEDHKFYLKITGQAGKSLCFSQPLILTVGCTAKTELIQDSSFSTSASFMIFDSYPNDIYTIGGLSMIVSQCLIFRYEIVDNTALNPTNDIQYPSKYVTSVASGCVDMLPMAPIAGEMAALASCNQIEVTTNKPQIWTFKIKAHYRQINPDNIAPYPFGIFTQSSSDITVSSFCGLPSTTVSAQFIDPITGVLENGIWEKETNINTNLVSSTNLGTLSIVKNVLLDEDNGIKEFELYAFHLTNPNCPMIYYSFNPTPSFSKSQISGPTMQPDYNYKIFVRTDILTKVGPFKIKGTAQGLSSYTSQEWTINVICGSETITNTNQSMSYIFPRLASANSFSTVSNSDIRGYFITDKSQCPVTHYELYKDQSLTKQVLNFTAFLLNGLDASIVTLQINDTEPLLTTFYVKGLSSSNQYSFYTLKVTVCGYEHLTLLSNEELYYKIPNKENEFYYISSIILNQLFLYDKGYSSLECEGKKMTLHVAETHIELNENHVDQSHSMIQLVPDTIDSGSKTGDYMIKIDKTKSFYNKKVYLKKTTQGLVSATQILNFEICGKEKIQYVNETQHLYFEFKQFIGHQDLLETVFSNLFTTNSQVCNIIGYKLYFKNFQSYQEYRNTDVTIKPENFNLSISTSNYWVKTKTFYIKPYTKNLDDDFFMPIDIDITLVPQVEYEIQARSNIEPNFITELPDFIIGFKEGSKQLEFETILPVFIDRSRGFVQKLEIRSQLGNISVEYDIEQSLVSFKNSEQKFLRFDPSSRTLEIKLDELQGKRMLQEISEQNKLIVNTTYLIEVILTDSYGAHGNHDFTITLKSNYTAKANITIDIWVPPKCPITYRNISAQISELSSFGELIITFNETMTGNNYQGLYNYSELINNQTLDIYVDQKDNYWDFDQHQSPHDALNFTWNVTNYHNSTLMIDLRFFHPLEISPNPQQDYIVLHFKEMCPYFISFDRQAIIDPSERTLRTRIRKQIPLYMRNDFSLVIAPVLEKTIMVGLISGLFLANYFSKILSYLEKLLYSLQMVFHLPMMSIIIPGNVSIFFQIMMPTVMFDSIKFLNLMKEWFPNSLDYFIQHQHELDQIANIGYKSFNPILNMRTIGSMLVLYFSKLIFMIPLKLFNILTLGVGVELFIKIFNSLFWGNLIWIFIYGYFEFLVSSILAYKAPVGSPDHNNEFYAFSVISLLITLVLIPLVYLWIIMFKSLKELNTFKYKQRWGMLYDGFKLRSKWDLLWCINNFLRRAVFVFTAFLMLSWPSLQVIVINYLSLVSIIIFGTFKPLIGTLANRLEMFNELTIMVCNFLFMCFTNFINDKQIQLEIGTRLIEIILFNIFVNMLVFGIDIFKGIKLITTVSCAYGKIWKKKVILRTSQRWADNNAKFECYVYQKNLEIDLKLKIQEQRMRHLTKIAINKKQTEEKLIADRLKYESTLPNKLDEKQLKALDGIIDAQSASMNDQLKSQLTQRSKNDYPFDIQSQFANMSRFKIQKDKSAQKISQDLQSIRNKQLGIQISIEKLELQERKKRFGLSDENKRQSDQDFNKLNGLPSDKTQQTVQGIDAVPQQRRFFGLFSSNNKKEQNSKELKIMKNPEFGLKVNASPELGNNEIANQNQTSESGSFSEKFNSLQHPTKLDTIIQNNSNTKNVDKLIQKTLTQTIQQSLTDNYKLDNIIQSHGEASSIKLLDLGFPEEEIRQMTTWQKSQMIYLNLKNQN